MIREFSQFFTKINLIETQIGLPKIYRHLAVLERNNIVTGSGFSINEKDSIMSAMGEAIERYCASIKPSDELENKNNLYFEKIAIKDVTRSTTHNDYNSKREWVNVSEMLSKKTFLMPSEMIYLTKTNYVPIRDIISTGLAAYTTLTGAIERGLCECIERDAFVQFWMLSHMNFKISTTEIKDIQIKILLNKSIQSGLKVDLYDISTEFDVPVILTVIQKEGVNGFYLSCAANFNYLKAIKKSLEEGLGGYSVYTESTLIHRKKIPTNLENVEDLSERPIYYLNQHQDHILNNILNREKNSKKIKELKHCYKQENNLDTVLTNMKNKNINVYYKDITTPDVKEVGFKVVRVIVPKLAFLPIKKPMLVCDRLNNKSIDLERDYNLEPHPFP